jgi:hypothetical protein
MAGVVAGRWKLGNKIIPKILPAAPKLFSEGWSILLALLNISQKSSAANLTGASPC